MEGSNPTRLIFFFMIEIFLNIIIALTRLFIIFLLYLNVFTLVFFLCVFLCFM